jgi:hypothetical protein
LQRQALKTLNTLMQRPEFVTAFIDSGMAPLLTQKALITLRGSELSDVSIPNLEALSLALALQQERVSQAKKAAEWLFIPETPGDENGIVYYLGTNKYRQSWSNPMDGGHVEVKASSLQGDSKPLNAVVGREAVRFLTQPEEKSWVMIDFKDRRIRPTHYSLRHYASADLEALRLWNFEGSADGAKWDVLIKHENDTNLDAKGKWFTWEIKTTSFYRYFRLFQTGKNSNNQLYLACSGFDVYGSLFEDGQVVKRPKKESDQVSQEDKSLVVKKSKKSEVSKPFVVPSYGWGMGTTDYSVIPRESQSSISYNSPPMPFNNAFFANEKVRQVSGFYYHTVLLTESGKGNIFSSCVVFSLL